jgi:hypothetical protein
MCRWGPIFGATRGSRLQCSEQRGRRECCDQHEYGNPISYFSQASGRQDEGCERTLPRMELLNACMAVDGTPYVLCIVMTWLERGEP